MNHEIMLYGIAQKEQLGFDKAVEECKYRMSRYGVTPNMLIMPPQERSALQTLTHTLTTRGRMLTRRPLPCADASVHGARP